MPQEGDCDIAIPVTFDYRGGRGENKKNKIIATLVIVIIQSIIVLGILRNEDLEFWQKILYDGVIIWVALLILRYAVFKEMYYSDIYETLLENDFQLGTEYYWQIFDVDCDYPYTHYFSNGKKGIFVRMTKGAITGKTGYPDFQHFDAISEAYNLAHSLNMDIVSIDYMDNVGNDSRLQKMYEDLNEVDNEGMLNMLTDIYNNLQEIMSSNYASFDIYLFLTRDNLSNFVDNVERVCNTMLGGNFMTYKVLDRVETANMCTALLNLHEFSMISACEKVLKGAVHGGIRPIRLVHPDGTVEEFNKTVAQQKAIEEENARKLQMEKEDKMRQKEQKKLRKKGLYVEPEVDNTEIDLFSDFKVDVGEVENTNVSNEETEQNNSDELDLF